MSGRDLSSVQATGKKPIIGLTGGIGAGKSEVARILEACGCVVLDSDRMAHEELQAPEVLEVLRKWWGHEVCTPEGRPDRRAIARIVFYDPHELERLERLLYPRLNRRREAIVAALEDDPAVLGIVLDAPKLYEAGVDKQCDVVIFVDAEEATRARRVMDKRGWSVEELRRRENLQIPLDNKRTNADHVIANHSSVDALRSEVERVFSTVLTSFSVSRARRGSSMTKPSEDSSDTARD